MMKCPDKIKEGIVKESSKFSKLLGPLSFAIDPIFAGVDALGGVRSASKIRSILGKSPKLFNKFTNIFKNIKI